MAISETKFSPKCSPAVSGCDSFSPSLGLCLYFCSLGHCIYTFFGGRLRDFYGMVGIDASHLGPLRCLMGVSGF